MGVTIDSQTEGSISLKYIILRCGIDMNSLVASFLVYAWRGRRRGVRAGAASDFVYRPTARGLEDDWVQVREGE